MQLQVCQRMMPGYGEQMRAISLKCAEALHPHLMNNSCRPYDAVVSMGIMHGLICKSCSQRTSFDSEKPLLRISLYDGLINLLARNLCLCKI